MGSSASSIALSSACRPPVPRLRVQAPQVEQPPSSLLSQSSRSSLPSSQVVQPPPLIPGNLFRTLSPTLSQVPPPRGSYGVQSELAPRAPAPHPPPTRGSYGVQSELAPRAPAPHLQFKSPRANSMPPGNKQQQQQQVPTRVEGMSPRTQTVLAANSSPSDSHLAPVASSGMSRLQPVLPATSLPSGSRTSHLAQRVPPAPNPALQVAMPSITTGMQPSGSGSLSLDAWLTASLGLSGDAPRATTAPATNGCGVDVVCLSDDESE